MHRGDLVAFRSIVSTQGVFIYRLIGLPGDTVEVRAGVVYLNGSALPQRSAGEYHYQTESTGMQRRIERCGGGSLGLSETCTVAKRFSESLPDGTSYEVLDSRPSAPGDDVGPFTVAPNHVFLLGDNRDNAADSRFSLAAGGRGMIPAENILGPVIRVVSP